MLGSPVGPGSVKLALLPWLFMACLAKVASAQQVEVSASQALFEEARQLMLDDRLLEACPKFAESLRLDPALGTLLNLALCHEKQGKSATAYLEYTDAVAQAAREGDGERRALAEQRIAALEPKVIRLSIKLGFTAPAGLWLELDGTRLEVAALGVALPVDPGLHTVEYGATGRAAKQVRVSVSEGDLRPELSLAELDAQRAPLRAPTRPPLGTAPASTGEGSNGRTLAMGLLFGSSAAALAVGAYAGLEAGEEWSKRKQHCRGGCDPSAKAFGDSAQRFAIISNVSLAVGLIAAGAGIYLYVSAPREKPRSGVKLTAVALPGSALVSLAGEL